VGVLFSDGTAGAMLLIRMLQNTKNRVEIDSAISSSIIILLFTI
jgi:hypothetical protein